MAIGGPDHETAVVLVSGPDAVVAETGSEPVVLEGRASVFDGLPSAFYLPAGRTRDGRANGGTGRRRRARPGSPSRPRRRRPEVSRRPPARPHPARRHPRRGPRRRPLDPPDQPHHRPRLPGRPAAAGRGPDAGRQLVELAAAQARRRRHARRGRPRGGLPLPVPATRGLGDPARLPAGRSPLGAPRDAVWAVRDGEVVRGDRRLPPVRRDRRGRRVLPQCAGRRPAHDGLLVRSGAGPRPVALVRGDAPTRVCRWSVARADGRGPTDEPPPQASRRGRAGRPPGAVRDGRARCRRSARARPSPRGTQRTERVAQAMLPQLGELDGGDDGGPARTRGEARPCVGRVVPASQAAQQVGTFDRDPVGRPGCREGRRPDRRRGPDGRPWRPPKSAGMRGDHHGTSPAGSGGGATRPSAADDGASGGVDLRLGVERRLVALEGLAQASARA